MHSKLFRFINTEFILLFLMSVLCLLFMHWQMALTVEFEYPFNIDSLLSNVFSCFIDVTVLFLLGLLFTWGNVRGALSVAFSLSMLLSIGNILYSRFFGHYLPNLAILQIGNLNDADVLQSIGTGFRPADLFYILWAAVYCLLYRRFSKRDMKKGVAATLGALWALILFAVASFILFLGVVHDHSLKTSFIRFSPIRLQYTQAPNNMLFRGGFIRRALVCHDDFLQKDMELDSCQIDEIENEYMNHSERMSCDSALTDKSNLIFIIVESYLSQTSDLIVDGKEITPFLNSLKRDSNVYYNGHVRPNIHIGESSDGQFIYMAGLLPLKSEITVNIVKDKTVCGLPALLKREGLIKQSRIVVPTSPTFWEQDAMNRLYGIDTTYSKFDWDGVLEGNKDLEDGQIFTMASKADRETDSPFFSLILTMSMHNPYKRGVDHGFTLTDDGLPNEYLNYLVDCHYFDMQLQKYIDELKRTGLYDNSLIVITADHQAHPVHLNMKEGQISDELPLYIINGGMDSTNSWTGPCNQLDIYTTLLDLYGIETDWRGLGHTLYTRDYKNSVSERTQELSEWIIRGNYWKSRFAE